MRQRFIEDKIGDPGEDAGFASLLGKQEPTGEPGFQELVPGVSPLRQDRVTQASPLMESTLARARQDAATHDLARDSALIEGTVEMVGGDEIISYKIPGMQPYVAKKLRLGEYQEADRLDLHGMKLEDAYRATTDYIAFSVRQGFRCILIIHGKGEHSGKMALIKSHLAKWLREIPEVIAYHSAPAYKGGTGAVLVILKKGDKESALNRELHARRGRH